jgi:hypothetical protein
VKEKERKRKEKVKIEVISVKYIYKRENRDRAVNEEKILVPGGYNFLRGRG